MNTVSEAGTDRVKAGTKKGRRWKKVFIRLGVGVAACVVLMLSVNVGSYALKQKSFLEIVHDGFGRTKVTVTGNEDALMAENEIIAEFSSWDEVEGYLDTAFLKPEYLPQNYTVEKITLSKSGARQVLFAIYNNKLSSKNLQIKVDIFDGEYSKRAIMNDSKWVLIEDEHDIFNSSYYTSEEYESVRAIFIKDNKQYILLCEESIEELKKITESMN